MSRQSKCMLYKTLTGPIFTYRSETPLAKNRNMLRIVESKILGMIYIPFNDIGIWRRRYNSELHKLCDEIDVVKVIKLEILRWLGHLFRMQELDPYRKLTLLKTEGSRVGKPKLKWLESVEKDLRT